MTLERSYLGSHEEEGVSRQQDSEGSQTKSEKWGCIYVFEPRFTPSSLWP